jgi:hypothetical protein
LQYLWGFPWSSGTSASANTVVGLSSDAFDNFWVASRWNLCILILVAIQYLIYTSLNRAGQINPLEAAAAESSETLDESLGDEQDATKVSMLGRLFAFLSVIWVYVVLLALLLSAVLGKNQTLIKLGYMLNFFSHIYFFHSSLRVERIVQLITIVYASCITAMKYIIQFESVHNEFQDGTTSRFEGDTGLQQLPNQGQLFRYIAPASLVVIFNVVFVRLLNQGAIERKKPLVSFSLGRDTVEIR